MTEAAPVNSLSQRTADAGGEALAGRRRGLAAFLPFVGRALLPSLYS